MFFGEDLPKRFFYYLKDFPQCDLVIIMGTSLEVRYIKSKCNDNGGVGHVFQIFEFSSDFP